MTLVLECGVKAFSEKGEIVKLLQIYEEAKPAIELRLSFFRLF